MWTKETMETLIDLVSKRRVIAIDTYRAAAVFAFEKQIPKPPFQACGHTTEPWMDFCPKCGQRLDWTKKGGVKNERV